MSKAKDLREAIDQDREEEWQCRTCKQAAKENDVYCIHCRMYWDDVRDDALNEIYAPDPE